MNREYKETVEEEKERIAVLMRKRKLAQLRVQEMKDWKDKVLEEINT